MKRVILLSLLSSMFLIPNLAQASYVRSIKGTTRLHGIQFKVRESSIYNIWRVKGRIKRSRSSRLSFGIYVPKGKALHNKSRLIYKGKSYPFRSGAALGKRFFYAHASVGFTKKRGVRYPRYVTLKFFLPKGKGKGLKKVVQSYTWKRRIKLYAGSSKRTKARSYLQLIKVPTKRAKKKAI